MNPTKEQIQWFWEQCGFTRYQKYTSPDYGWEAPIGIDGLVAELGGKNFPEIPLVDLNNLFKYAVPKLNYPEIKLYSDDGLYFISLTTGEIRLKHTTAIRTNSTDPALALFWAIYKALGGKE